MRFDFRAPAVVFVAVTVVVACGVLDGMVVFDWSCVIQDVVAVPPALLQLNLLLPFSLSRPSDVVFDWSCLHNHLMLMQCRYMQSNWAS